MTPALQAAGRRRFVSLTTFRRSGVPVSTAVWIAPDDDALVVTTGATTGKAKRLRNDARVELRECSRLGTVKPGAPFVTGRAEIVADPAAKARHEQALAAKYGIQYRVIAAVEQRAERRGGAGRIILRITDA